MALTLKQKKFVEEYVISGNATEAATKAGYSRRSAHNQATRMMKNDEVLAYKDQVLSRLESEKIAQADEILQYLTAVMRGESSSEVVVVEGDGDGCSSARTMEKAPDEKERLKAAELLGKRFGLFTDKVDLTGGEIVVTLTDEASRA